MSTLPLELEQTVAAMPPDDALDTLAASLDPAWIAAALAATGTASLRRRRLPAEQVVWLVLAMALYRDRPLDAIVQALGLAMPGRAPVTSGALPQARDRLGAAPLAWLFDHTAEAWTRDGAPDARWRGLRLLALDGTTLRVPDSDANRDHFGAFSGPKGVGAYPLVRVVALLDVATHLSVRAVFGPCTTGEHAYADRLWAAVPDDSLVLLDRNFVAARLFLGVAAAARRRHLLVRGKATTAGRVVATLGPHDERLERRVPAALRAADPTLPATYVVRRIRYQRRGFRPSQVLTTLLDAAAYPAAELIARYHDRWEVERAFDEVKTTQLDARPTLRSQTPDRITQEVWGVLLVYNLVRREMALAAHAAGVAPTRLSFVVSLRAIRDEWWWLRVTKAGTIPRRLSALRTQLCRWILPERRVERRYARVVKRRSSYTTQGGRRRPLPKSEEAN